MSSTAGQSEEVFIGPVESGKVPFEVRTLILPTELDQALSDYTKREGVLASVLSARLFRELLESEGFTFTGEMDDWELGQERLESAREELRHTSKALTTATEGLDVEDVRLRVEAAFGSDTAAAIENQGPNET